MKCRFKKVILVLTTILVMLMPVQTIAAQEVPPNYQDEQLPLAVKSAIAIDSQTGQLLYGRNIAEPLPIASMTKLLTVYLTLKAIQKQQINWQTTVKPTPQIVAVAKNRDFSNVPLHLHHHYTIRQLYQATLIESANGAAMLLAQTVGGSQVAFVKQMRRQLRHWGIKDASLYTACGLPNKSVGQDAYPGADRNAENMMSAKDMALVGQHLLYDFPQVIKTTRIARKQFRDGQLTTPMVNFNWMLKTLPQHDPALKVDGLKTGTTDAAGACFIGTAKHAGARIITVVMGARHRNGTDPARFNETNKLLKYIYHHYQPVIFNRNEVIMGKTSMPVTYGQARTIRLGMQKNSVVWVPKRQELTVGTTSRVVAAPVKTGQVVNSYYFEAGGEKLLSLAQPQGLTLPAQALQGTNKVNFLIRFWRWLFGG